MKTIRERRICLSPFNKPQINKYTLFKPAKRNPFKCLETQTRAAAAVAAVAAVDAAAAAAAGRGCGASIFFLFFVFL